MEEQNKIIQEIEERISSALNLIKELTPDNFNKNFSEAYSNLVIAKELRENVSLTNLDPSLFEHVKKVNEIAKLLEKEYDNIVEKYLSEMNIIGNAIKTANNKRKLASYSGGVL